LSQLNLEIIQINRLNI